MFINMLHYHCFCCSQNGLPTQADDGFAFTPIHCACCRHMDAATRATATAMAPTGVHNLTAYHSGCHVCRANMDADDDTNESDSDGKSYDSACEICRTEQGESEDSYSSSDNDYTSDSDASTITSVRAARSSSTYEQSLSMSRRLDRLHHDLQHVANPADRARAVKDIARLRAILDDEVEALYRDEADAAIRNTAPSRADDKSAVPAQAPLPSPTVSERASGSDTSPQTHNVAVGTSTDSKVDDGDHEDSRSVISLSDSSHHSE